MHLGGFLSRCRTWESRCLVLAGATHKVVIRRVPPHKIAGHQAVHAHVHMSDECRVRGAYAADMKCLRAKHRPGTAERRLSQCDTARAVCGGCIAPCWHVHLNGANARNRLQLCATPNKSNNSGPLQLSFFSSSFIQNFLETRHHTHPSDTQKRKINSRLLPCWLNM